MLNALYIFKAVYLCIYFTNYNCEVSFHAWICWKMCKTIDLGMIILSLLADYLGLLFDYYCLKNRIIFCASLVFDYHFLFKKKKKVTVTKQWDLSPFMHKRRVTINRCSQLLFNNYFRIPLLRMQTTEN